MILTFDRKKMFNPVIRLLVLSIFAFSVGLYCFGGKLSSFIHIFLIVMGFVYVPFFYLFFEYLLVTKDKKVEITSEYISISKKGFKPIFTPVSELSIIKLYKSKGMEKGNFPVSISERFYHAEIYPKQGEKIVLTSFLDPDFELGIDLLNGVKKETRRTLFSTIHFKLF